MGQQDFDSAIALRNDSHQFVIIYDQHSPDPKITHNFQDILYGVRRSNRENGFCFLINNFFYGRHLNLP
jgi:hypothetical protein